MEEKTIIQSEQYNLKKLFIITVIIGAILSGLMLLMAVSEWMDVYDTAYNEYLEHQKRGYCYEIFNEFTGKYQYITCGWCEGVNGKSKIGFAISESFNFQMDSVWDFHFVPLLVLSVFGCILYFALGSYEMTITTKRVYGKAAFGKRVDLPIDSVSAIGSKWPKGISVATSSGKISFLMIKNCDEIHKCVSDLLIERQSKPIFAPTPAPNVKQEAPVSNADELKKYKELLDSGVITQEEFDAKKKQLLGL